MKRRSSMTANRLLAISSLLAAALLAGACSRGGAPDGEKTIKSTRSGNMTITLSNSTGELSHGENDLLVSFADESGKLIDVGAAALNFQMAAMGTMPEMNNKAALTTTGTPGKYRARAEIEMAGTWEGVISYEGGQGRGLVRMTVNVK